MQKLLLLVSENYEIKILKKYINIDRIDIQYTQLITHLALRRIS